jgi:hypothetical protein
VEHAGVGPGINVMILEICLTKIYPAQNAAIYAPEK